MRTHFGPFECVCADECKDKAPSRPKTGAQTCGRQYPMTIASKWDKNTAHAVEAVVSVNLVEPQEFLGEPHGNMA